MNDNKKTLVLSIVGVLVLVLVVVGVSYAMYTFTGTGTRENVITTGSISVTIDPSTEDAEDLGVTLDKQTITLNNQYPMTDAEGTKSSEVLRFYVAATFSGETTINYEIGMEKQESSLEDGEVKVNLNKKVGTGEAQWLKGTATTGVLVSTFAGDAGTLAGTTVTNYLLDSGSFSASGIVTYEMQMWVDENYDLPTTNTNEGNVHSNETTSENYSFKIKTYAAQQA